MKLEPFLSTIQRYVTGGEGHGVPKIDRDTGIAYLGAGYWRAVVWAKASTRLADEPVMEVNVHGVTLVNPDRSWEEIQAVELGVSILAQLEYKQSH
jgi:hypothetical protein